MSLRPPPHQQNSRPLHQPGVRRPKNFDSRLSSREKARLQAQCLALSEATDIGVGFGYALETTAPPYGIGIRTRDGTIK
jgi:hypothetical protein